MAVRRYGDLEKEILEGFEKEADAAEGWCRPVPGMPAFMRGEWIVTAQSLKMYVSELGPCNPF